MTRLIARVLALVLMTTSVAVAQNKRVVTAADYDRATKMLAPNLNGLVVGGSADATWLPDGRFSYVRTTLTGTENVIIDPVKKTRDLRRLRRAARAQPLVMPGAAAVAAAALAAVAEDAAVSRSQRPAGPTLPEHPVHHSLRCRQTAARLSLSVIGIFGCAMSPAVRTANSRPTA